MSCQNYVSHFREQLINLLVSNLVSLRARAGLNQAELAEGVGIGRQTLLLIENKKGKMRWDTFLAVCVIFSNNPETSSYMRFLELHLDCIPQFVISGGEGIMSFEKIWTDYESEYQVIRSVCPLPIGLKGTVCPKCGSKELTGALITPTSDEADPNILCKNCGYWRD